MFQDYVYDWIWMLIDAKSWEMIESYDKYGYLIQ